jgi:nucleoside-diphosphate-sugar epimerase
MLEQHAVSLPITGIEQLESRLSEPTPRLIETMKRLSGDILVLGAAGKMGPTLARMARRSADQAGGSRRIIGVARFSDSAARRSLEEHGIETIQGDLLDPRFVLSLPNAPNVVYAAGMKFGSTGNEPLTWAVNTHLPTLICRRYPESRIVAFSTGNVYGVAPADGGGSRETDALKPVGEYAMSCLGRERMFEYFSAKQGTPVAIVRLNYATELRYGVLLDLAQKVWLEQPIDVAMGFANVIWQADANAMALCLLEHTASPANIVNLAGPEILRVRQVCEDLGAILGRRVRCVGQECTDALLSNGAKAYELVGRPRVSAGEIIRWTAEWVRRGGDTHGKPTHFEVRDGKF